MKAAGASHATASHCETAAQREAALHLAKLSRCPTDHWHAAIEARLASPSMTMLVVGANKGYGVLELLQRYTATNVSGVDWQQQLQSSHAKCGRCCGICNDCRARLTRGLLPHARRATAAVRVHAFEVLPVNVAMLRAVTARFGLHAQVEVHAHAVSNSSADMELAGRNPWRNSKHPGYECATPSFRPVARPHLARPASAGPGARQKRNKGSGTIALQATTVDAFVAARRVERVHVLEVDANGMDALVLEGAAQDPNPRRSRTPSCAQTLSLTLTLVRADARSAAHRGARLRVPRHGLLRHVRRVPLAPRRARPPRGARLRVLLAGRARRRRARVGPLLAGRLRVLGMVQPRLHAPSGSAAGDRAYAHGQTPARLRPGDRSRSIRGCSH